MSVRSSRRSPLINGAVVDAHVAIFDGTTGAIKDGGVPAGTGTVTTTGSPANGNLTKFSGATSITNADLTGDVTTAGTVAATVKTNLKTMQIIFVADGGSSVLTTGVTAYVSCPCDGTIVKWRVLSVDTAVTSGSITIDIWKDTFAHYPPVVGDSICGTGTKPNLSTETSHESATFTNYTTTTVTAGDVFGFSTSGVTSVIKVQLELTITLT